VMRTVLRVAVALLLVQVLAHGAAYALPMI
jgi:hypothetical protein